MFLRSIKEDQVLHLLNIGCFPIDVEQTTGPVPRKQTQRWSTSCFLLLFSITDVHLLADDDGIVFEPLRLPLIAWGSLVTTTTVLTFPKNRLH